MEAASSSSSGTANVDSMTGNTRLTGASAQGAPLTRKGKAAVQQDTTPNRPHVPETGATQPTEDGVAGVDPDVSAQELEEDDSEPFTPTNCLFCTTASPDLASNLSHMSRHHSLLIPASIDNGSLSLAVDPETLVRYMHLVVSTYRECLLCHTQRQSAHAVRQHMVGKGHCRIDLEDGGSEFRDFYERSARRAEGEDGSSSSGEEVGIESGDEADSVPAGAKPLRLREGTLLLASGKLLSHRSAPAPRPHHRPLSETQKPTRRDALAAASSASQPGEDGVGPPPPSSDSTPDATTTPAAEEDTTGGRALTRLERRAEASGRSALSVAMSQMSLSDRAALAHLPAAEQRAVVLRQFKQQDRARHEARRFWSKMERKNNSVLMKHFVSDVPGPKLG